MLENYNILTLKPEGERPLGGFRHRWENTIQMDFEEMGCEDVDWIHLARDGDRGLVNTVMCSQVP
jgi:hypothetical protein